MITKNGAVVMLENIMDMDGIDLLVHLAKNNPGAADADLVIGDLTEADFTGYAAKNGTDWPDAALNGANQAQTDSGTLTWTKTGGAAQTTYLVYATIKDKAGTRRLYAVGRFAQPQTVTLDNDTILAKFNFFAWNGVP